MGNARITQVPRVTTIDATATARVTQDARVATIDATATAHISQVPRVTVIDVPTPAHVSQTARVVIVAAEKKSWVKHWTWYRRKFKAGERDFSWPRPPRP